MMKMHNELMEILKISSFVKKKIQVMILDTENIVTHHRIKC